MYLSLSQSINHSINQAIAQANNRPIKQSINQTINQSVSKVGGEISAHEMHGLRNGDPEEETCKNRGDSARRFKFQLYHIVGILGDLEFGAYQKVARRSKGDLYILQKQISKIRIYKNRAIFGWGSGNGCSRRVTGLQEFDGSGVSSPTAKLQSIRAVLKIAGCGNWDFKAMDVTMRFKIGPIRYGAYVKPPYASESDESTIWKLINPFYRWIPSGMNWYVAIRVFRLRVEGGWGRLRWISPFYPGHRMAFPISAEMRRCAKIGLIWIKEA